MPIRSKKIQWVTSPFNNSAWFGLYPCYGSCFVCVWLHHLVRTEFITVYNHDSNESLKIASALILRHITTRYTQTIPDIHNSLDQTLQICWAQVKERTADVRRNSKMTMLLFDLMEFMQQHPKVPSRIQIERLVSEQKVHEPVDRLQAPSLPSSNLASGSAECYCTLHCQHVHH